MLRFGNRHSPPTRRSFVGPTRSVWMLLAMLGAVLLLMRQMQQPETVELLGQIFSASKTPEKLAPRKPLPTRLADDPFAEATPTAAQKVDVSAAPWATVEDNAVFLSTENEAWFLLWDQVQRIPPAELQRQAIAEVAYAQLVNQPDVYRAQPVRVRGRVLQESVKAAPKNSLGITEYHQLVLAPKGGGDWPIMAYCLDLPPGFPRGEGLEQDVALTGLFFKNWSYPYDGGMGLAPVLVTNSFDWRPQREASRAAARPVDVTSVWVGVAGAMLAAVGVVFWVYRQTRRSRVTETPPDLSRWSPDT